MPLHRRLPKRGFTNIFRKDYRTVNVERLNAFEAGSVVTPETLQEAGLLKKGAAEVKVLGNGETQGRADRPGPQVHQDRRRRRSRLPAARSKLLGLETPRELAA